MMTKRATVYETTDGKWHKTRKQADAHQALIDFSEWYEDDYNNHLYGVSEGSTISSSDLTEWLITHRVRVVNLIDKHAKAEAETAAKLKEESTNA